MREDLGARVLTEESHILEIGGKKLLVGGVSDFDAYRKHQTHRHSPAKAVEGHEADFKLLLAHQPRSVEEAQKAGFQYMVNGHTHGGQFFPFNIVIRMIFPYVHGNYVHQGMPLYVSPGTGFWGPINRAGVTPEVTLHVLKKGPA